MEVISTDNYPHGLAVKRRAPGPTSWGRKWSQDKVWGELTARLMLVGETLQRGKDGWDKREKRDLGAMSEWGGSGRWRGWLQPGVESSS